MIRKSDQSYKVVKARTAKALGTKVFGGLTYYRVNHLKSMAAAKKFASSRVREHNMVRILDVGKPIAAGRTKCRYFIYTRSIPYSIYSKW
jgi:hypothetical protein